MTFSIMQFIWDLVDPVEIQSTLNIPSLLVSADLGTIIKDGAKLKCMALNIYELLSKEFFLNIYHICTNFTSTLNPHFQ